VIAVDTSALMAVLLNEVQAGDCDAALRDDDRLLISAGTLTEALIVAGARNLRAEMLSLIDGLGFEVVLVTAASARRAAAAHWRWGKGRRRGGLNFGDCFAYELAKDNACPLLYVGEDFSRTDIESVL
jgi:ribonuclease VapC